MSSSFRGIGTETASVMLIIVGVTGYLLAPVNVARLLTLFVIYLGARDVVAPGRGPNTVVLAVGIWAALSAYGFFGLSFLNSWPLLIVLIGVSVIVQSFVSESRVRSGAEPQ